MAFNRFSRPGLFSPDPESRFSGGASWNDGMSRRSFLKRTGGATAATLVAWHSASLKCRAEGEESATGGSEEDGNWGPYLMRLQAVWPANGEEVASVPFEVVYQGALVNAFLWLEIMVAPPLGGFPEKSTAVDFGYSVVVSVGLNGQALVSKVIEVPAHCQVDTYTGELTSWVGSDPADGGLPPSDPEEEPFSTHVTTGFQLEPDGPMFGVLVELFPVGAGGTTALSGKATVSGPATQASTGTKTVLHVFESFREDEE
jgi:hypothetical protein